MPEFLQPAWLGAPAYGAAMFLALGMLIAASVSRSRTFSFILSAMGCGLWLGAGWFAVGSEVAIGTALALCFFTRSTWAYFQSKREPEPPSSVVNVEHQAELETASATLDAAQVGLWSWDLSKDEIRFSKSWLRAVGDEREESSATPEEWLNRIHPNYVSQVRQAIAAHLDGETEAIECDYRFRARDGGYVWVLNRAKAERDSKGNATCLSGCQIDITSIVDVEKQVLHDAYMDRLTGLPNRLAFMPVLERACEHARGGENTFALLFLDLDKFKTINDHFGHAVGDELLAAAAQRLEEGKGQDGFVARLGGDEFVVLYQEIGSEEAALAKARFLHESLSRPYDINGREVQSGASIGVAMGGAGRSTAEAVLHDADQAMYQAKSAKKGVAVFGASMRTRASLTQNLQQELAGAAERAELELHFQPIVCLRTHVVQGAEALLRWKRRGTGYMQAAEFIPLAEDAGLLAGIGEWAIRAACVYRRGWLKQGFGDFCVSVNVSASQLQREDFGERVIRILKRTELPANLLQIEINESSLASPSSNAARNLQMLIEHGVLVAIDDFGSGEASLSRLTSVPLHAIKLDREFVAGIDSDISKQSIVRGVVSLAHAIRLRVAAEGVETEAVLRQVEAEQCDMAQGYYFSRPMPAGELIGILRKAELVAARRSAAPAAHQAVV